VAKQINGTGGDVMDAELYRLKIEQIFSSTDRNIWDAESKAAGARREKRKVLYTHKRDRLLQIYAIITSDIYA
jgi:hypothetical protein